MLNQERFRFEDFTLKGYEMLLQRTLDAGYKPISYSEYGSKEKWVIWRHDIDFSPQRALKVAEIEAKLGIKSTYFLLLHSKFYNLLEASIKDIVFKIIELGHDVGVHFDLNYYGIIDNENDLGKYLKIEKNFLSEVFSASFESFSFHTPSEWAIALGHEQVSGCINAYSSFFMKNVGYASDSNGIWRNEPILSRIEEGLPKLQLLTHPVWWTDEVSSPKDRFLRAVNGRSNALITEHQKHWEKIGRPLIDW